MKKIIVAWFTTQNDKEMRVVYSDHEKFTKGTRFDFGFMQIASSEGYVIELLP